MKLFEIDLQLFADGGAPSGAAGAANDAGSDAPTDAKADGARVLYGKQPARDTQAKQAEGETSQAESKTESVTQPRGVTRREERSGGGSEPETVEKQSFEQLIKGEYKDDFDKMMSRRFKKSAQAEEQNASMRALLETVAIGYGLDPDAPTLLEDIKKAQDADDELYQKAAYEKGVSPEEYRRELAKDRQIKALSQKVAENERRERDAAWVRDLQKQVPQVKQMFPNFDLDEEMKNPDFAYLVRPGSPTSIEAAMYAIHHREILSGAVKTAAQQAAQQTANAVAANRARPKEGGLSSVPPTVVKDDPSKWSKEDLAEIRRRVARGEKIVL